MFDELKLQSGLGMELYRLINGLRSGDKDLVPAAVDLLVNWTGSIPDDCADAWDELDALVDKAMAV